MNNNEPTNINIQLSTVNEPVNIKEIISSWLDVGFKLGIALGAFISWAFFSFFVNALPSLGSIGDIAIYLISISAWSLIVSGYIVAISFASSYLIKFSSNFNSYDRYYLIWYYVVFPILSFLILWCLATLKVPSFIWSIIIPLLLFDPLLFAALLISNPQRNFLERLTDIGFPLMLYSPLLLIFLPFAFNLQNSSEVIFIILTIIFLILINIAIINGYVKNWKIALGIAISYLAIISIIFAALKIDNPIIVQPFKLLKLGYYQTELHFKDDFINKSNPFPLNETNQTSNVFFVLSSIGDEYILRETRAAEDHNDSNVSNHRGLYPFDYNETRYYCEDDNASLIWKISDLNNTHIQKVKYQSHDFNKTIEKLLSHWKTIDQKTYRIKKENIEFEIVGKEIEKQSTIWNTKQIQNKPVILPPPIKPKAKADCNTTVSKQACYCSYPNNNLLQTSQP